VQVLKHFLSLIYIGDRIQRGRRVRALAVGAMYCLSTMGTAAPREIGPLTPVGPARYRAPRHKLSYNFHSRNEGEQSALDDAHSQYLATPIPNP